jgi:hypothetical protein
MLCGTILIDAKERTAGHPVASCKSIRSAALASTFRLGTIRSDGRARTVSVCCTGRVGGSRPLSAAWLVPISALTRQKLREERAGVARRGFGEGPCSVFDVNHRRVNHRRQADDHSRTCARKRCWKTARGRSSFAVYHSAPSHASMTGNSIGCMMDGGGCSRSARNERLRFLQSVRIHGIANHVKAAIWRAALRPNAA